MARRRYDSDGTEKRIARQKIIDLFTAWPGKLDMLTLPGTSWTFERQLLTVRLPERTYFTSCENNRAKFAVAIKTKPTTASFLFGDVDNLMAKTEDTWDAAWLDYYGPLTIKRLAIIKRFYQGFIRDTLIITALKTRWPLDTGIAIDYAGGHSQWLKQNLNGELLHDFEYLDTTPMIQFAIRHRRQWWM
jgi:hypothetical protein